MFNKKRNIEKLIRNEGTEVIIFEHIIMTNSKQIHGKFSRAIHWPVVSIARKQQTLCGTNYSICSWPTPI